MPVSLADVLAPATQADLLSWVGSRSHRHLPSAEPGRWAQLFSWNRLGDLIARRQVRADDVRIFSSGRLINPNALGVRDDDGELRPLAVQALMRQGASLAVSKIQGSGDALWNLACDVERRLGDKVSITAVASFSSAAAMPLHYDAQDILVMQVDGAKQWSFLGEPVAGSGVSRPLKNPPSEVTGEVTLSPGDVLFVPSGQHHRCRPLGRSLHLSILVRRLTGQHLADHLRARLASDPLFDTPVPRGQGEAALADYERALKARLSQIVEETRLAAVIGEADEAQQGVTRLDLLGQPRADRPSARISLLPRRPLALRADAGLRLAGREIALTPALGATLERLDETGSMTIATLREAVAALHGGEAADAALQALLDLGVAAVEPG